MRTRTVRQGLWTDKRIQDALLPGPASPRARRDRLHLGTAFTESPDACEDVQALAIPADLVSAAVQRSRENPLPFMDSRREGEILAGRLPEEVRVDDEVFVRHSLGGTHGLRIDEEKRSMASLRRTK